MRQQILNRISIPDPCHEDWSKMTPNEKGAFCESCEKSVWDFSKRSPEEIKSILDDEINQGKKVCGRFNHEQLNQPTVEVPFHKLLGLNLSPLRAFAASVVLTFGTALFIVTNANGQVVGEVAVTTEKPENNVLKTGKVAYTPQPKVRLLQNDPQGIRGGIRYTPPVEPEPETPEEIGELELLPEQPKGNVVYPVEHLPKQIDPEPIEELQGDVIYTPEEKEEVMIEDRIEIENPVPAEPEEPIKIRTTGVSINDNFYSPRVMEPASKSLKETVGSAIAETEGESSIVELPPVTIKPDSAQLAETINCIKLTTVVGMIALPTDDYDHHTWTARQREARIEEILAARAERKKRRETRRIARKEDELEVLNKETTPVLTDEGIPNSENTPDLPVEPAIRARANLDSYPNPTTGGIIIEAQIPETGFATVELFDLSGRKIRLIESGIFESGTKNIQADLSDLTNGTYICTLKQGAKYTTSRIVISH